MSRVLTYTTNNVSLSSTWTTNGTTVTKPSSTATDTRTITVSGIPINATVLRAWLSVKMKGIPTTVGNYYIQTVNGETVSGGGNEYKTNLVRMEVYSNRAVTLTFVYRCIEYARASAGTHTYTSVFEDITLNIEIEEGEDEGYTDNEVLIPVKGIMLYDPKETDFTKNGLVLHPSSCTVSEEAAGMFELDMQIPMDADGRWELVLEDCIIKAPVPPYKIPETTIPVGTVYQVKSTAPETTPLYSQLPTYSKADDAADDSSKYGAWSSATSYKIGARCIYGGYIFEATKPSTNQNPSSSTGYWALVAAVNPSSSSQSSSRQIYNPGVIIRDIPKQTSGSPTQVTFIATYNWKYIKIRDNLGNIGYGIKADYEEAATAAEPIVIPARTIYTQLFRVYDVSGDEADGMVTVSAKHISYDFECNRIFDCKMTEASPATAIALLQGRLMNPDSRLIACPIEYPLITADWSFQNPVQAILDPDIGLASQLQANVLRDNGDYFILPKAPARIGARLAYGVNLRGVTWERNLNDLVTRIIPRAGNGSNGFLYLDELFIDSPLIGEYAVVHTEVLDSEYSVGQEIELADGTKRTLSRSEVIERMRQESENRYYVDGADKVVVSLDVEFVLLGDTEEFKQYRNLQRVNLYDRIIIDTGNMATEAQVIGYEWDCLMGRYNGISIGKVYSQARKRIPGYRVATGAITYSKLSPGLIKWIRGAS